MREFTLIVPIFPNVHRSECQRSPFFPTVGQHAAGNGRLPGGRFVKKYSPEDGECARLPSCSDSTPVLAIALGSSLLLNHAQYNTLRIRARTDSFSILDRNTLDRIGR